MEAATTAPLSRPLSSMSRAVPALQSYLPAWPGHFPPVKTLAAQGLAAVLVIGSFLLAKQQSETSAK